MQEIRLRPQPGPQRQFLETKADIAIFGGAAGGGKTYALLLEPLRHYNNPNFGTVIFRRNNTQIRNEGGLWDESMKVYGPLGAKPRESMLDWTFPRGGRVKFWHLEYASTVQDWHGSQIPLLGLDELTTFLESQFWYMQSRNRSDSGVSGYTRATCNPDADSWVRKFIDWWIDNDTGFPIPERSGVLRWFIRLSEELIWADSKEELIAKYGAEQMPQSLTFIPSKVQDNKILMAKDPTYLAKLRALPRVERMRLLEGNWNVRRSAGAYFQKSYFEILEAEPAGGVTIRWWDRASTKPHESNKNPDWTAGVKMKKMPSGIYVVCDVDRFRDGPLEVERRVTNCATIDGREVEVGLFQDPGSAGASDVSHYTRNVLKGFRVRIVKPTKDKITQALGYSASAENNNVKLVRGKWNEPFLTEHDNFPAVETSSDSDSKGKDDQVDGAAAAYNYLEPKVASDWAPINIAGQNRFA